MAVVDITEVRAATRLALKALKRFNRRAHLLAEAAAQQEIKTHTYQNRTGKLEGGTSADLVSGGSDGWVIILKQGAFYGVFVQARGFSDFEQIAYKLGANIYNETLYL